jgi:hypothetical protein
MCEVEDSQTGSTLVADNVDLIDKCGIKKEYEESVKVTDESTMYDKIFIEEVKKHFDCGLIKGLKSICASCISEIKKNSKVGNETSIMFVPRMVNFKGLFTGSIPTEHFNLTSVEDSMINIYRAISNVCLAGGKHYKMGHVTQYFMI